jgi:hypothetical protein
MGRSNRQNTHPVLRGQDRRLPPSDSPQSVIQEQPDGERPSRTAKPPTVSPTVQLVWHPSPTGGFGTAEDPLHPDWNIHFAISSVEAKRIKKETRYTMTGVATPANNPANVGLPVTILAETRGDATAVAITLGDLVFAGPASSLSLLSRH